ncbi:MAG: EamA family transporter [Methylotenera sp.]
MQSFETLALFSLVLFFNAFGSVMLKKGASQRSPGGNFSKVKRLAAFAGDMVTSKQVIVGLLMQIFAFVGWLAFISHVALSFAFPLSSINNVTILLASRFLLHERISPRRWSGVLFILGGIVLITSA